MSKEQRVFKNNGKRFEQDFAESFPDTVWTYRPKDSGGGMMARFTHESLCDLMAYNTENKDFVLFELKSTLGTSVSVRPYEQCMEYEEEERKFAEWNAGLTAETRKPIKEEIKEHKKAIKELYKATNLGMIKYHQIKNLLEVREQYGIQAFIAITFFKSTNTYAVPIEDFVEHWKQMDKKSVNEDDLDNLVEQGKAFNLEQEYIRKTMRSTYNVSQLVK